MTREELRERVTEELRQSSEEYCLYCLEYRGEKWSCCKENHFSRFVDLYEEDQAELIEQAIAEYEENL